MKEILENIESSIPEKIKMDIKKRIATAPPFLLELSSQLRNYSINNYDVKNYLFKNNEDALYFSGDILAKTLHSFWIKGGNIEEHFIESAQRTSYSAQFECLWS